MIDTLLLIVMIYGVSIFLLPFPHWPSFFVALREVIICPQVTIPQRASMLMYLVKDVLILPVFALFWLADEVFYSNYKSVEIKNPVFIMSQPRSGTTFLLRSLSQDKDTFLSLKHLEWRYPFISFWKLIDFLGLRNWLENRSYWPNTKLGKKCDKIHYHVLGSVEEFGIFLEERFYLHYFLFRRFPFLAVLDKATNYGQFSDKEKRKIAKTFTKAIKKAFYYRGTSEIFLTKENEAVDFYEILLEEFPDARFLFIVREPSKVLDSYRTMSLTCTEVKHGLHPEQIPGWHEANIAFRKSECEKFIEFYSKIQKRQKNTLITFNQFTTDIYSTTLKIYRELELTISPEFQSLLQRLQLEQNKRDPGYQNETCEASEFDFYADFVLSAENTPNN
ncbi:MAG: sulfotransferase [Sneathiella sp.]